jgi:hypothetical protein
MFKSIQFRRGGKREAPKLLYAQIPCPLSGVNSSQKWGHTLKVAQLGPQYVTFRTVQTAEISVLKQLISSSDVCVTSRRNFRIPSSHF